MSSPDPNGQKLGYFYFEEDPGRRSVAKLLHARRGGADRTEYRRAADLLRQAKD
jgi:hypothetical protein